MSILTEGIEHGLYKIPSTLNSSQSLQPYNYTSTMNNKIRVEGSVWHDRLGHLHQIVLDIVVKGINQHIISYSCYTVCSSCQMGKSHKLSLRNIQVRSSKPFEIVHMDIRGP